MLCDVWAVWPSALPDRCADTTRLWQRRGYKVAVLIDKGKPYPLAPDLVVEQEEWKGYPSAINHLCALVPGEVVVCAGDDIYPPDEMSLGEILHQFLHRFPDTYGVMQPTGDRFGSIDECCPSPWIGRAFIKEAYSGTGPFWPEYFHYFCDEELKVVAEMQGVLWQRSDISQYHDHWQREEGGKRPPHLMTALERWKAGKNLFAERKRLHFPGHERKTK